MSTHLHMQCTPKSRRGGIHAADLAAYRAGARFEVPAGRHEPRSRQTRDYRDRQDVRFSKIVTPHGVKAPPWVRRRAEMWTRADDAENKKDARIAREWIIALPRELPRSVANGLAKSLARLIADRYGCVVDVSVHDGTDRFGRPQPHAHILCTTRRIEPNGFTHKTTIEWSEKRLAEHGLASGSHQITFIRKQIAARTNAALAAAGIERRVEYRSYRALGVDVIASGRPKRHGRRGAVTRRQLARLRRNTSGPGLSEAGRRMLNAARIASEPSAFLGVLDRARAGVFDGTSSPPGKVAIMNALAPLVPSEAVADVASRVVGLRNAVEVHDAPARDELDRPSPNASVCAPKEPAGFARSASSMPNGRTASPPRPRKLPVDEPTPRDRPTDATGNSPPTANAAIIRTDRPDPGFEFDKLPGEAEFAERKEAEKAERDRRRAEGAVLERAHRDAQRREFDVLNHILQRRTERHTGRREQDTRPSGTASP